MRVPLPGATSRLAFVACAALCACGGGSVALAPGAGRAALPAAIATGCIDPSTQTQTAALPSAGGVSGTITLGALPQAATNCLGVTVATGSDATLTAGAVPLSSAGATTALAARRKTLDASPAPLPTPVTQIELSNTYTGNLTWVAVTLNLPPGSVPAGSYPATITTTIVLGDGQTATSVANFNVVVDASGKTIVTGPNASQFLATLNADTTGVLTLYPAGTVLPNPTPVPTDSATPSPSPSPSASSSANPSASPSTPPTVAPTATPTLAPTPSPVPSASPTGSTLGCQAPPYSACGTYTVTGSYYGGSNAGQVVTATPAPVAYNQAAVVIPGYYFGGTVTITLPNYYPGTQEVMEAAPYNSDPCPGSSAQLVESGPAGDTYTLTLPANGQAANLPPEGNGLAGCFLILGPQAASGSSQGFDQFINVYYNP